MDVEFGNTLDGVKFDTTIEIVIKRRGDVYNLDVGNLYCEDFARLDFFFYHECAYQFYVWYARNNGFFVRKSIVMRNIIGKTLQQTFICSHVGYWNDSGLTLKTRKREEKMIQGGCNARFHVHVNFSNDHWYVTYVDFDHNHDMLDEMDCAMLLGHKKLSTSDIMQIKFFNKVGIIPPIDVCFICEQFWWIW